MIKKAKEKMQPESRSGSFLKSLKSSYCIILCALLLCVVRYHPSALVEVLGMAAPTFPAYQVEIKETIKTQGTKLEDLETKMTDTVDNMKKQKVEVLDFIRAQIGNDVKILVDESIQARLKQQFKTLEDKLIVSETTVKTLTNTNEAMKKSFKTLEENIQELKEGADKITERMDKTDSKIGPIEIEIQNIRDRFTSKVDDLSQKLGNEADRLGELYDSYGQTQTDITQLTNQLEIAQQEMKRIEADHSKTHEKLESKFTTLETNLKDHVTHLTAREKEVRDRLSVTDNTIAGINTKTLDLVGELSLQKGQIKTVSDEINQLRQTVQGDKETLSTKIDTKSEQQSKSLGEFKNTTSEELRKLKEQDNATENLVKSNDEAINKKYTSLEGKVNQHKSSLDSHQTEIQNKTEQINETLLAAKKTLETAEHEIKNMTNRIRIHEKDLTTAFDNLFRKEVAIFVIVLLLVTNFGLIIAVYVLCQRSKNGGKQLYPTRRDGSGKTSYYNPVLDQIPPTPTLQKAIGVISFSREYQPCHQHLVRSVTDRIDGYVTVNYHVILKIEDIPKIPHYSMIVICVEYSDRDVIIEESGYGLGDCNKTTLAAVEKIGAVPVIVYCKDLGSQRLPQGKLYRPSIRCATMQEELKPLSSDNRFFSVYDDFSEAQEVALKYLIQRHVF